MKRYSETPKKVFICSPLRPRGETEEERQKDLHRNQQLARFACRYATEHGYMPMAPHLYFTQFLDDADPQDREDGIHYGLKWLEECDEIWVIERRITEGMKHEIAAARNELLPVKKTVKQKTKFGQEISGDRQRLPEIFFGEGTANSTLLSSGQGLRKWPGGHP